MPDFRTLATRVGPVAVVLLAIAVRLHNVAVFPGLRAPDGFGHFTYIWHMTDTWRVPLATSGWSFFHPPLYYAFMAAVWHLLADQDPVVRLQAGTAVVAVLGLLHAAVSFYFIRHRFPEEKLLQLVVPSLLLFLPVQLYSAGYLGNEALSAVLCSASLLALLLLLEKPTNTRAALLGLGFGLGMLTKFTALSIVAAGFATIGLRAVVTRQFAWGIRMLAIAGTVMLAVCGWFYARNLSLYGTPFQMSRDTLAVRRVEDLQTQGKRDLKEYLLFDPMVIARPQWPRGLPLVGPVPPDVERSALRESVWTGVFANTFFDAVGGQVLPLVTLDNQSRRAGQVLLSLAVVPSVLLLAGLASTLKGLWRHGWSDSDVAMVTAFAATLAIFIVGTKSVPMHAAVKATYLAPAWPMFGYWIARGLRSVRRRHRLAGNAAVAACMLLCAASVTVFTLGEVVGRGFLEQTWKTPLWQSAYGIVEYAGGRRDQARALFDDSATADWHLGEENAAAMAQQEGRTLEALYRVRTAARLQPKQSFGLDADRKAFENISQAEYRNLAAVLYYKLGWMDEARRFLDESLGLDDSIPEAQYDRGLVALTESLHAPDPASALHLVADSRRFFSRTLELDPAFHEAHAQLAFAEARLGRCEAARVQLLAARIGKASGIPRAYPVETCTGDLHAAALERRRHVEDLPAALDAEAAVAACKG